ncbi:CHAT domain-containing protein [Dactylosporangium matsuzakiense]|uniref:CHAT domain-containing protein n=1 Tax=Dactylosporangium matsuzakiense TaxID=53360 RepID=A0A9W6KAP4_9ACTN|nr:CHAT domain-containing protein [Dactylosporangium matsuzakiense]UWZ47015.1 CHAT domain-containing protein [Dactylosporangium matsuzakiense]GLK98561.1 hypothetical protein GCM10017581_003020 [Dactylosporangium matsuzakiense]
MTALPGLAPSGPASVAGVLTAAGPGVVWAWIALDVQPVPDRTSGEGSDAQRRAEAARADAAWLAGQWDPGAGTRLELRYLHRPGEPLRCCLLGRVQAPTADAAIAAALRLRDRLGVLPAHVRAAPVADPAGVGHRLDPFPAHPSGLVEVRKPIRAGWPSRPDAGVAYYLAVPRFAGGAAGWEPLWQSVAGLEQPFMLTVGLEPCTPSAGFLDMLTEVARNFRRLATAAQAGGGALRGGRNAVLLPDPFAQYAAPLYEDAQWRYRSGVFRTRMTIASTGPLPVPLVTTIAATICGPHGDGESAYHIVVPEPDELGTAWHNVATLDNLQWDRAYLRHLPGPVPPGVRLLAEVMDAAEAASGWRLPPAPSAGRPTVFNVGGDYISVNGNDNQIKNVGAAQDDGPKRRILLVCAGPRDDEARDRLTARDDRLLRAAIQRSAERDRIEVVTLNAATIDDLRQALMRGPFDIVHFSGHGTEEGLVFEDDDGQPFVPASSALAELFARRKVRVAVLNACYSLSVGGIAAIGTEFTIAAAGLLSDPGAVEFTRGFYDALGAGLEVPDAFAEGRGAAALKGHSFDAVLLRSAERPKSPPDWTGS